MLRTRLVGALLLLAMATPCAAEKPLIKADGTIDTQQFNAGWRKYSDIDERIPVESRSWEAQQYQACLDEIAAARLEIANLQGKIELDREAQLAMRDYQTALDKGLKVNLLKSFWRMTWLTYNTIGGPTWQRGIKGKEPWRAIRGRGVVSTGKDYGELLSGFADSSSKVVRIGKMLSIIKKFIPKEYSKRAGDSGKVVNVGFDAAFETMKNLDESPTKLAASVVTKIIETGGAELLSLLRTGPELTADEIDILRTQNNDLQIVKQMLAENEAINKEREARIDELNKQIENAQEHAKEWEDKEKSRVFAKVMLEADKPKGLKVSLESPGKLAIGKGATIHAEVTGGSGRYSYYWIASSTRGSSGETSTTREGGSSMAFRGSSTGPHTVRVRVTDQANPELYSYESAVIEVTNPPAITKPLPPTPPPAKNNDIVPEIATFLGAWRGTEVFDGGKKFACHLNIDYSKEKGTYIVDGIECSLYGLPAVKGSYNTGKLTLFFERTHNSGTGYVIDYWEQLILSSDGTTITGQRVYREKSRFFANIAGAEYTKDPDPDYDRTTKSELRATRVGDWRHTE